MTVPYSFGAATSAIPLSQLDSNFNTPITLGNTAIQLGNTVTTLNNMTLANVTASGTVTINGGTANAVQYLDGSKVLSSDANFVYNATGLGVGTGSPSSKLDVSVADNSVATKLISTTGRVRVRPYVDATNGSLFEAMNTAESAYIPLSLFGSSVRMGNGSAQVVIDSSGNVTLSSGTANAVAYLNTSKVLTTGSALTFDGTSLGIGGLGAFGALNVNRYASSPQATITIGDNGTPANDVGIYFRQTSGVSGFSTAGASFAWYNASPGTGELMRLTSTGLGIGTSSPYTRLDSASARTTTLNSIASFNTMPASVTDTTAYAVGVGGGINFRAQLTGSSYSTYAAIWSYRESANNSDYKGSLLFGTADNSLGYPVERMRLDSSGNLGLGVTPSTGGYGVAFQFAHAGNGGGITAQSISANNYPVNLTANAISSGVSTWKYFNTDASSASRYEQRAGVHSWHTAASGTAGNSITFTQAMTLDASGNLTLGGTTSYAKFTVTGSDVATNAVISGATKAVRFGASSSFASIEGVDNTAGVSYQPLMIGGSDVRFSTGGTGNERARIDSSGNLIVGDTATVSDARFYAKSAGNVIVARFYGPGLSDSNTTVYFDKPSTTNTTSQVFVAFTVNAQATGSGQINANGASQAAFGSFSDRRLKENIVDLPPQLDNIMALRPVEFDYIQSEGGGHQVSFIAQEFEEIYPDAVGERADGMKTLTGWGKTEARLVKAIQELKAEVDSLKAQLKGA